MSALTDFDKKLLESHGRVAGLDEAGRGALAGPVFVGCLSAPKELLESGELESVNDSKQLSEANREELFALITKVEQVGIGIGQADNREIDELGINRAAALAGERALRSAPRGIGFLLLDRGLAPESDLESETLEKGDEKSFHIAGASILAKVARDRYMRSVAEVFPDYGWETNVGYGTEEHRGAVREIGPTPLHRKSYKIR